MSSTLRSTSSPAPDAGVPSHLRRVGVTPSLREYIGMIWDRRDFLLTIPLGELRAQNQNTILGSLWHLLNPLLLAATYYLVFGVILGARNELPRYGTENYASFLIIAIIAFNYVNKTAMSGARTVVSNLKLIQSIRFPRATLPISSTLTETLGQGPALVTMLLLVVATGTMPKLGWLLAIPATLLMALFGLGLSFITARATFHFRDVEHFLPFALRLWMYLSGIFYPVKFVQDNAPEWAVTVFKANPMWQFFTMYRDALILGEVNAEIWAAAAAWSVVIFVFGFQYFRANEAQYSRA